MLGRIQCARRKLAVVLAKARTQPQGVVWRRLVARYSHRLQSMDFAVWVLAFAKTTSGLHDAFVVSISSRCQQ